ncbi:MAG: hypothetical protein GEU88_17045 [Solirubrobacterales bacterium]|nr:hypothetical protein [Solirubrobacterales bacterium]
MARKRRKRRPPRPPAPAAESAPAAPLREARPGAAPRPRRPIDEQRPPAPWGSFPLVELVVLVALVMLVVGFFVGGTRGALLLGTGLALGSLAGLELSIREHFGGFRSHTLLLAGAAGIATLALLFYALPDLLSPVGRLIAAAAVAWSPAWRWRAPSARARVAPSSCDRAPPSAAGHRALEGGERRMGGRPPGARPIPDFALAS